MMKQFDVSRAQFLCRRGNHKESGNGCSSRAEGKIAESVIPVMRSALPVS